jgi:hypothetical protein
LKLRCLRRPQYLHPFVVQRFIDESLVLARYGADSHYIARDLQF